MTTEIIDVIEKNVLVQGGSKVISLPSAWNSIVGINDNDPIKMFLCYGKFGYFIAIAPKIQKKKETSLD